MTFLLAFACSVCSVEHVERSLCDSGLVAFRPVHKFDLSGCPRKMVKLLYSNRMHCFTKKTIVSLCTRFPPSPTSIRSKNQNFKLSCAILLAMQASCTQNFKVSIISNFQPNTYIMLIRSVVSCIPPHLHKMSLLYRIHLL